MQIRFTSRELRDLLLAWLALGLAFLLFLASRGIGMHIGYRRSVLPALP